MAEFPYELDYNWEHPWPRSPIPADEGDRLQQLQRYNIMGSEKEDSYNKLCAIACNTMKCPIAAISFIDGEKQWFKASTGLTQTSIPRDVAFCAHALMTPSRPLVVHDASKDERFKNNPLVTRASSIKFYASIPLCSNTGHAIGSIFVFDTKAHESCDINKLIQIATTLRQILEKRALQYAKENPTIQRPQAPAPNPKLLQRPKAPVPGQRSPAPVPQQQPQQPPQHAPQHPPQQQALVPMNRQQPGQGNALALQGQGGGPSQLGGMLIGLLARTTETQQQLANQQGMMFQTLGHHAEQITALQEKLKSMEARMN